MKVRSTARVFVLLPAVSFAGGRSWSRRAGRCRGQSWRQPLRRQPMRRQPLRRHPLRRQPMRRQPLRRQPLLLRRRQPLRRQPLRCPLRHSHRWRHIHCRPARRGHAVGRRTLPHSHRATELWQSHRWRHTHCRPARRGHAKGSGDRGPAARRPAARRPAEAPGRSAVAAGRRTLPLSHRVLRRGRRRARPARGRTLRRHPCRHCEAASASRHGLAGENLCWRSNTVCVGKTKYPYYFFKSLKPTRAL